MYFLLGRENKYCVNGKYTYCDFGGGVDPNETQLEKATNTGPGLAMVSLGKVSVTKYNGSPTDTAGSSVATAV